MTILTEPLHPAEFVVSEANGTRSRGTGTLISGQDLDAGAVLGIITASGKLTELAPAAGDGSEAAAAILWAPVDASGGDAACVILERDAEVDGELLQWPTGITVNQKATAIAELKAIGILVR